MSRFLFALSLIGSVGLSTAQATTWTDYEEAFPAFPCMDGWMACYQDGERVTPDLQRRGGMPSPANARVDWFTLEPTSGFSPFVGLTAYSVGGAPAPEPAVAEVDPMPEPSDPEPYEQYEEPEPTPTSIAPRPEPMERPEPMVRPEPMARPEPAAPTPQPTMVRPDPAPVQPAPVPSGGMVRPGSGTPIAVQPSPEPGGMVRPGPAPVAQVDPPQPVVPAPLVATNNNDMVRPGPTPAPVPDPEPAGPVTCDDLVRLESAALIGRLTDEQVACLEASFADVGRQTEKKKISLLLIANANGKGDKRAWEGLVRRHLDEIDQSDPDICFAYAQYLARKGPGRAEQVIRWSEVALENRTRWVGETYKSRVYNLYKLRAAAANTLWERASATNAEAQTDESEAAVERTRGRLKTYAREWYEYAKDAGKDTTIPRQLCISAAGSSEFCEGR